MNIKGTHHCSKGRRKELYQFSMLKGNWKDLLILYSLFPFHLLFLEYYRYHSFFLSSISNSIWWFLSRFPLDMINAFHLLMKNNEQKCYALKDKWIELIIVQRENARNNNINSRGPRPCVDTKYYTTSRADCLELTKSTTQYYFAKS